MVFYFFEKIFIGGFGISAQILPFLNTYLCTALSTTTQNVSLIDALREPLKLERLLNHLVSSQGLI